MMTAVKTWLTAHAVKALLAITAIQGTMMMLPATTLAGHIPFSTYTWADLVALVSVTIAVVGTIAHAVSTPATPPAA